MGTISKTGFKIFSTAAAIVLSSVLIFGLNFSMSMTAHGDMINCPFMQGHMSLCPMNASEHISQWNSTFTSIPQKSLTVLLLTIISFGSAFIFIKNFLELFQYFISRYKRYRTENPDISLFNYLASLFIRGILQPKLYA